MSDARGEPILLREGRIDAHTLRELVDGGFGDMVKYVVDLRRRIIAVGGELHADAETVLLADGSRQEDLWGANYYPARPPAQCIEFASLINIRPSQNNLGMQVQDAQIRERMREITSALIGSGEATS